MVSDNRTPIDRARRICPGCSGSSMKIASRSTSKVCEMRSITEPSIGSNRTSFVSVRPNSIKRPPVVQPVAIKESIQPRLNPFAKRLEQKRRDDDGDHAANRAVVCAWKISAISATQREINRSDRQRSPPYTPNRA